MWRLDQAALVTVGEQVRPRRLSPSGVYRGGKRDEGALGALLDPERTLVTLPGDELEIRYSLPEGLGPQRVFLEARGYYLEWMRQEWMSEQDAAKALQLLVDPGDALKALAPAYKAVESEIEHLFWSSRYGRH